MRRGSQSFLCLRRDCRPHSRAYANTWHTYEYSRLLSGARSSAEVAGILRERGIRYIVAPVSLNTGIPLLDTFLREWAEPAGVVSGRMGLFLRRRRRS